MQGMGITENQERSTNIKDRSMLQSCCMEIFAGIGDH
jgi:hypothetical protein